MHPGRRVFLRFLFSYFLLVSFLTAQEKTPATAQVRHEGDEAKITLHEGWTLQTSAKTDAKGEVISTPQFSPKGWHEVSVPTTVVAALVKEKALPDPFF